MTQFNPYYRRPLVGYHVLFHVERGDTPFSALSENCSSRAKCQIDMQPILTVLSTTAWFSDALVCILGGPSITHLHSVSRSHTTLLADWGEGR